MIYPKRNNGLKKQVASGALRRSQHPQLPLLFEKKLLFLFFGHYDRDFASQQAHAGFDNVHTAEEDGQG